MFSLRNIFPDPLFRCPLYEFEDIIREIDSVEMVAPECGKWFDARHSVAKTLAWRLPVCVNPGIEKMNKLVKQGGAYELLFAVCGSPADLLFLNTVNDFRRWAKRSVCLLDEMWAKEIPSYRYFLKVLSNVDFVMLYYSQSVMAVSEFIGRPCFFLPPGVDALLFCPYPQTPRRVVDVYSIGRRGEVTHQVLLKMMRERGMFYIYDSIAGNRALNSQQHRLLLANTAKRSRYYLVNPGLIDRPDIRGNQIEIGNRYFEGAGAGAIMVGEEPNNKAFGKLFDWEEAVIRVPYDSADIERVINELDAQPARQERMRRNNVINALMRHDWVYRWETVLNTVGLEPIAGLFERKERLRKRANDIMNG